MIRMGGYFGSVMFIFYISFIFRFLFCSWGFFRRVLILGVKFFFGDLSCFILVFFLDFFV